MTKARKWDYALSLKGLDPQSIPMSKLAEYLSVWAALLGVENIPILTGVIKGSVLMPATIRPEATVQIRARLQTARYDKGAAKLIDELEVMAARDGLKYCQIIDSTRNELLLIKPKVAPIQTPLVVSDQAEIDGVVYRISGKDDTTSVSILEHGSNKSITFEVRNNSLAQEIATHFKAAPIRAHVHGTWLRNEQGLWEPKSIYADRIEALDLTPAENILRELGALDGGWKNIEDHDAFIADLRGSHA